MQKSLISTCVACVIAASAVSSVATAANTSPRMNGVLDYEIGGGMVSTPTGSNTFASIGIGVEWKTNMSCGNFDPSISISNQLNGITEGFKNMMSDIVQNATSAVASLPMLVIMRANPSLADLLQNGVMSGKLDFEAAETSCEGFQNLIMDGDTSALPWMSVAGTAKERVWENAVNNPVSTDQAGDAVAAKDTVRDTDPGNEGIVWVCGDKAGGAGQPTIKSTADVIVAGYGILHDSTDICDTGEPSTASQADSVIFSYWETAQDAADWVVEVVGEVEVASCDDCDKLDNVPGKGLEYKLRDEKEALTENLEDLVSGAAPMTWANLSDVSAPPAVRVNAALISELRKSGSEAQVRYIEMMAEEIGYARLIEQTRLAIRMMRAGQREPNVAAFAEATPHIESSMNILHENLEMLRSEAAEKRVVASRTVKALLIGAEKTVRSTRTPNIRQNNDPEATFQIGD